MADREPSREAKELAAQVERDGGRVLALYQEPVGEHWQIFCLLPRDEVRGEPVSARPLADPRQAPHRIDQAARPLRGPDRGRLAPAGSLLDAERQPPARGPRQAQGGLRPGHPGRRAPDGRSRSSRSTSRRRTTSRRSRSRSSGCTARSRRRSRTPPRSRGRFSSSPPHFITLGLLYEENKRFAGGAFAPILRRVDKFLEADASQGPRGRGPSAPSSSARPTRRSAAVVAKIKKRGINHPYVKNYLLARTTPLTRARKTLPSFDQTFKKLRENLEEFDVAKVRYDDIQRSAIMGAPAAD